MRGDFSRDSFAPAGGFTRVLRQQGRIEIDADGNEASALHLRQLRQLAADLIGPFGGPPGAFLIGPADGQAFDFTVAPGVYYVDGWRIENPDPVAWRGARKAEGKSRGKGRAKGETKGRDAGAGLPGARWNSPKEGTYFAWLDVWERHLTALEHDGALKRNDPRRLADVALGGQDTASRVQTMWTVRLDEITREEAAALSDKQDWSPVRDRLLPPERGRLVARAVDPAAAETDDPCLVAPTSAYRGVENQLYRVEIWQGGTAKDGATFVWSRENGAVLFAVERIAGNSVRLAEGWHDARFGLGVGDFVSIEGPDQRLDTPAQIFRVTGYDGDAIELELDGAPSLDAEAGDVVLRRWDHRQRPVQTGAGRIVDGALAVVEDEWITLEDGISISFAVTDDDNPPVYRPGDHWLIPARTAIGDILWPADGDEPAAVSPHGIERRAAPMGVVLFDAQGTFSLELDLRREFNPMAG